jgi:hypothetical protein
VKTQTLLILAHLQTHDGITSLEALGISVVIDGVNPCRPRALPTTFDH